MILYFPQNIFEVQSAKISATPYTFSDGKLKENSIRINKQSFGCFPFGSEILHGMSPQKFVISLPMTSNFTWEIST